MKKQDLMESLGEVDEVWLVEAARAKRRNTSKPLFVIAAALLLAFSFALGAFAATAVLQAETPEAPEQETVDFYVPPKHVVYDPQNPENTTFELIKLYADAVTAQAIFRLTLPEGTKLSPNVAFSDTDASVYRDGARMPFIVTKTEITSIEKDSVCFRIIFTRGNGYPSKDTYSLNGRQASVELKDLCIGENILVSGTWRANFVLPNISESRSYTDMDVAGKVVTALPEGWQIPEQNGEFPYITITLNSMPEIEITPMSVYIEYTVKTEGLMEVFDSYLRPWELTLVLRDGSTVKTTVLGARNAGIGSADLPVASHKDAFAFSDPIDPRDVTALIWGDLTIDLRE
ncbi:MAG: hypothetical protein J6B77_01060 [Clostridia bacterium]|nr:hypothetical protein [Clostridia bacterium]